ncbi:MAG: DUF6090 family protein [Bacteroidota bacterium]
MKSFRKNRQSAMDGKNINSYLRYAVSEVFLVVLGILIAVSINNWNEARQQQKLLDNILAVVTNDLESDTLEVGIIVKRYETLEPYFARVQDSLDREGLKACNICAGLVTSFSNFAIEERGYNLLQNFVDASEEKQDTVVQDIVHFYKTYQGLITIIEESIRDGVNGTLEHWRDKHDWYADFINGQLTEEYWDYVSEDPKYKNRLAHHYLYVYKNYIPVCKSFKKDSEELLEIIAERFANKE